MLNLARVRKVDLITVPFHISHLIQICRDFRTIMLTRVSLSLKSHVAKKYSASSYV